MVWTKNIKFILIFAALIRFILLPLVIHGDITTVYWWGKFATDFTWRGYYDWLEFGGYNHPDQPMLYIYFAYIIRIIYLFFYNIFWFLNTHIQAFPSNFMSWYFLNGNQILLKVPFVIADLLLIFLIFKFTKNLKAAFIIAIYPPLIYNSAVWGSGDSLINLLGLSSLYLLFHKKYLFFTLLILLSLLFKPSLLIWSPLILVMLIKNKVNIKNIISMVLFIVGFIYLISYSFAINNPLIWFLNIMFQKILPGVMHQLTSNAMNFWALVYGLKPQLDELLIFNFISARFISLFITFTFFLFICFRFYKNYNLNQLLLSLVQTSLIAFTFMTRMHERYTFPALIPLFLLCFYNKKFTKYFVILTLTHLINVYHWWWYPRLDFLVSILDWEPTIRLISLINVIVTLILVSIKPLRESKS